MKASIFILSVGLMLMASNLYSQDSLALSDKIEKDRSWFVTVGFNVVDDSGDEYRDLFSISEEWNYVLFPSRFSIGKNFKNGLGLEIVGSYNRYEEGKIIDGVPSTEDIDYLSADFRVNYDLNQILGDTGFFDPYVGIGVGYADANNQGRGTYNALFGFRTWFSDRWGLDFSSTGKWTMNSENSTNHIQHAVGLAYRFGFPKKSKKEENPLPMELVEETMQAPLDTIVESPDVPIKAEDLMESAKEKEELARLEAEKLRRKKVEDQVQGLEPIYFELNSSYLKPKDKLVLDGLAKIMEENPSLVIAIGAHADSRGTQKYNQWLSERRLKRIQDYLSTKNISQDRVTGSAEGEEKLVNDCRDRVPCTEEQHRKNRRAEFVLVRL